MPSAAISASSRGRCASHVDSMLRPLLALTDWCDSWLLPLFPETQFPSSVSYTRIAQCSCEPTFHHVYRIMSSQRSLHRHLVQPGLRAARPLNAMRKMQRKEGRQQCINASLEDTRSRRERAGCHPADFYKEAGPAYTGSPPLAL